MKNIEVPVLIVGGGGAGLSASIYLSDHGIEHILIERHQSTSPFPKGHYLNQRSLEIMRQHGLADQIYEQGAPMKHMSKVYFRTSFGGDKPYERRNFYEFDAFGGGALREQYEKDSPCTSTNLPQVRFEPFLRTVAEKREKGPILYNHELVDFTQDDEGVTATIRNRGTNENFTVRAQYMIAADGGKKIGPKLGVKMEGPRDIVDMVNIHFKADLSEGMGDAEQLITFLPSPDGGLIGFVPVGPTWGPKSEEWSLVYGLTPEDPKNVDNESAVSIIRKVLRIYDLKPEIISIGHWFVEAVLAEKYCVNRVFLVGDAAHRHPSTTGLGLNTALQDSHNLAWKLAAVINGEASPSLLDSYESERRKIGRRNVDWALFTFLNHPLHAISLGLLPGQLKDEREAALDLYFSNTALGASIRARAAEVIGTQRIEFSAHDLEIGFYYDNGALVSDGTEPPEHDPMGNNYQPTTRPGHRLPHAWIEQDGKLISTLDLVGIGEFLLIIGSSNEKWSEAIKEISNTLGVQIKCISIGDDCDYHDPTSQWKEVCQITEEGAILVRPDNHVAWRTKVEVENPLETLTNVMNGILGKKQSLVF